jgi:hypothetical protein
MNRFGVAKAAIVTLDRGTPGGHERTVDGGTEIVDNSATQ